MPETILPPVRRFLGVWAGGLADRVARRVRTNWIRAPLDVVLARYERFGPTAWIDLPEGRTLCAIAPHPDDESIGPGGLIAAWTAAGRRAEVAILTAGEAGSRSSRETGTSEAESARIAGIRRGEGEEALRILGARGLWLDGPDGALAGAQARLIGPLADWFARMDPDLILAPFPADRHPDHAVAAWIAGQAASLCLAPDTPVLGYEVWSPAPANALFDIGAVAPVKLAAIAAHRSQVETTDYVTAARALAQYRAIAGGRGDTLAEAYHRTDVAAYAAMARALRI